MKKSLKNRATSVAFFLFVSFGQAQNLIPNAGFEAYEACPTDLRQLDLATGWFGANAGTPEYFNTCGFTADVNPRSGKGLVGVILFSESSNNVEYLQIELSEALVANREYLFHCYVKISKRSSIAINKIGVLFSKNGLHSTVWKRFSNSPQLVFNKVANQTDNWQKLEGNYIAKGGERYITFGNFFQKHFITEELMPRPAISRTTYYYFDDFYLGEKRNVVETPLKNKKIQWSHTVYFEKDSSRISAIEMEYLINFIAQLPEPLFSPVQVQGHTDKDASFEYNLRLSQNRANEVKKELESFNLSNVYTTWSGEEKPASVGESIYSKKMNRRVTITIQR